MSSLHHKAWLSCAVRCGLLVTALGIGHSAFAQVPGMVSFQGVLKDGGGTPLSGPVTLDFRILDAQTAGNLVDMDGDGVVENTVGQDVKEVATQSTGGVVSVAFGPVSPSVFNGQPRFIEVTIVNPGPATALARVPMTTAPAVAEQLFARGTTTAAVTTDAAGNVGIGTDAATPYFSARLHVNNGQIAVSEPFQDQYVGVFIKGNYNGTGRAVVGSTSSGPQRGPFSLVTADTERLTIDTNGRVGIGTIEPQAPLEVYRVIPPSSLEPILNLVGFFSTGSPAEAQAINFHVNNSDTDYPAVQITQSLSSGAGGVLSFRTSPNYSTTPPSDRLTISANGNVGIGRVANPNRLEIEGDASKTTAGSWLANSDRRIKRDIKSIHDGLEVLDRVRVTSFKYTDEYRRSHPSIEDRNYLGVIAQEFAQVFPEHVRSSGERLSSSLRGTSAARESDEILQVDSWPLTVYSVAAIQELHAKHNAEVAQLRSQNDLLRGEVAGQKQQIDELSERVARLEALLADSNEKGR